QTPGSGISILLAVGTPSTGSGNLYCQWELSPGSGNTLCILFPTPFHEDICSSLMSLRTMSSSNYPIIVPSDFDVEDAFSSTHSPDYFPAPMGNTSHDPSNDLTKDLLASLAISPFHDDPYMKEILPPRKQAHFLSLSYTDLYAQPQAFEIRENYHGALDMSHTRHEEQIEDILNRLDELSFDHIEEMEGYVDGRVIIQQDFDKLMTELQEARAQIAGLQRKQMRRNDKIALARFRISTQELIIEDIQAAIWQLITDSVAAALKAQAANMVNTDKINRNLKPKETLAARKCTYKEFMSYQPFYFNDALSWWNSYAKPIGIEQADKIAWTELKRLLTNKYCPRTEVKKMEDEFYNLVVKENDLKTYARRFQELATICPNMVPNNEKLMEVFIDGLPQSIEGTVTASKPQTLEEAINIARRLLNQVLKHGSVQGTNDHKRKFYDRRNTTNNADVVKTH
nr:reverse transcriptase domain-containing protein [Tanacetum cinerariifolium]